MGSSARRRPRGVSTSSSASSVFSAPIVCSRSMAVRTERSSGGCTAFDRKVEMLLSVLLATEEASSSSSPPLRTKARQPLYSSSLILRHSSSRGVRNISGTCGNEYDPTHSHTHTRHSREGVTDTTDAPRTSNSAMLANRVREQRWKHTPGWTRPARPRRCRHDALDVHTVCSELHLV